MRSLHDLIETFLDNRDALTPKEMSRLARELDRSEALAAAVKDQLVMRELLSQKLAEDRRNFPAQVAQRRRDFERGEEELYQQVLEVRSLAAEELKHPLPPRRTLRRFSFWGGLALALIVAVTVGLTWEQWRPAPTLALLTAVEGEVMIARNAERLPALARSEIKSGDRLTIGRDATATLRYPDGTTLLLDSQAIVQFLGEPTAAKLVLLSQGGLSADVAPQSANAPLTVETARALVRVLGTELFVYATSEGTRVGVTDGRIALVRRVDGQEKEITAGNSGFASTHALEVWEGVWPSNLAGAALVLESETKARAGFASVGGPQPVPLVAQGRARLSEHGALVLDDGAYIAEGAGEAIFQSCGQTGELTVETIVRPNDGQQRDAAILVFGGSESEAPNFALTQSQDRVLFFLKTARAAYPAGGQFFDLAEVSPDVPRRLVVTFRSGRLACYVDGRLRYARKDLPLNFTAWKPGELIFGDQSAGAHNWRGVLEGVAIYNRVLCKNEIQRNAAAYETILDQRRPVSFSDTLSAP